MSVFNSVIASLYLYIYVLYVEFVFRSCFKLEYGLASSKYKKITVSADPEFLKGKAKISADTQQSSISPFYKLQ